MIYIISLILTCCLTACQGPKVLADYLRQPDVTEREYQYCKTGQKTQQCALIKQAMHKIMTHAFSIQANPQAFGKRVMAVQIEIIVLSKEPQTPKIQQRLLRAKQRYAEYMALINWLNQAR